MRWVICALVVLVAPAGARAGDFDVLRGAQPVGYASYTRWSGFYGGGLIGEEFEGADFRNVGASEITTIAGLSAGFDGIPLSNFPRLTSLNTETPSYSAFVGYNYQFEAAVVGFELTFTKTSFSASINDSGKPRLFPDRQRHRVRRDVQREYLGLRQGDGLRHRARPIRLGVRQPFALRFWRRFDLADQRDEVGQRQLLRRGDALISAQIRRRQARRRPARSAPIWTLSNQVNGKWYLGYVAGLGLDYALTQNLFLRGEFQYIQFGAPDNIRLSASSVRIGAGVKF